jgi:hypothetical protein
VSNTVILEKAGFAIVGEWLVDGESIKLSVRPAKGPAVYAFLLDGEAAIATENKASARTFAFVAKLSSDSKQVIACRC